MSNSTTCPSPYRNPSVISLTNPDIIRSYLSLNSFESDSESNGFIRRDGNKLVSPSGKPFKMVGPNIYWLGTDENLGPRGSFPSSQRVLDAFATAAAMGATTVRSTTLGVSVGFENAIEPSLGVFNNRALDHLGFVVYVARIYAMRLVIPLTDQYDYYHGGYRTFLKWQNISETDMEAFYTNSTIKQDFLTYFTTILNHTNPYTQIKLREDPTIMVWETGNELENPHPKWTEEVSIAIKNLAPNQLIGSGRYGVDVDDLNLDSIDLVTDHFYPPSSRRYYSGLNLATNHQKVYFVGEFDWKGRTHDWTLVLAIILPGLVSVCTIYWIITTKTFFPFELKRNFYNRIKKNSSNEIKFKKKLIVKRWQVLMGFILISSAVLGGVSFWVGIHWDQLEGFLRSMEDSSMNGGLFWSLFGRDDGCCDFVEHNDGFTLHYPGQTEPDRRRVKRLITHAARVAGRIIDLGPTVQPFQVDVACPQIAWKNGTGQIWDSVDRI